MTDDAQLLEKGRALTKYVELKYQMGKLAAKAHDFRSELDRVSAALKAPLAADPAMLIPEPSAISALLREIHETAAELQNYRANLINFGVEPKD